ncbi:MAG: hypothetical protein WA924_14175 [Burkholderiaceae bacterium]
MDQIPFEKVTLKEAKAVLDSDGPQKKKIDWTQLRRPLNPHSLKLTDFAVRWLFALPKDILPKTLAREYPRIINQVADRWDTPPDCLKYLDQLLIDERGTRQGFSNKIVFELHRLKAHLAAPVEE